MKNTRKVFTHVLIAICILFSNVSYVSADEVRITSEAGISMDYETGDILYEKNADKMLVPASMTKIMTAYIVFEELEAGNITKETKMVVSRNAANMSRNKSYPMAVALTEGSKMTVDILLKLIMLPSASASCVVLAESISGTEQKFAERMNKVAEELGLEADFKNSHGARVHYITAKSVATLNREFIKKYPDFLNYTSLDTVYFNGVNYKNLNRLLSSHRYEGADGIKTGSIPEAGYCLASTAKRDGKRVITIIMKAPTLDACLKESSKLLDIGFAEIGAKNIAKNIAKKNTEFTFVDIPEQIRKNSEFYINLQASNVTSNYNATGRLLVNGETLEFENMPVTEGENLSFKYCLEDINATELKIDYLMDLADGTKKKVSMAIPISAEKPALFKDISGHWIESVLEEFSGNQIFTADENGYFNPSESLDRATFITYLGRFAETLGVKIPDSGETKFSDVQSDKSYYKYVAWAEKGLSSGTSETSFSPNSKITREQVALFLSKFIDKYEELFSISIMNDAVTSFDDAYDISSWGLDSAVRMTNLKILISHERSFKPSSNFTKADMASMFYRFYGLVIEKTITKL